MTLTALSVASDAPDLKIPGLGKDLWPYQRAGVEYAMRTKRLIIADEMGLGKTVQALATLRALDAFPAVVVCPAYIKATWKAMIVEWLPGIECVVIDSKTEMPPVKDGQKIIFILNYDILSKFAGKINGGVKPRAVIGDEAHYVKNKKSQRTKAFKSVAKGAYVRLLLTGTPVDNRPSEFVSLLEILGREQDFGGSWYFLNRYCNAHRDRFGYWDFSGSSNLSELNENLRATCYVRRLKKDVQSDLPERRIAILPVEIDNASQYAMAQADLIAWLTQNRGVASAVSALKAEAMVKIETLKQLVSQGKMKAAEEWIKDFMESGEKLVVFVHHVQTAKELHTLFPESGVITGHVGLLNRGKAIEDFNLDPFCQLLIISIQSGGLGIDLTSASNCLFLELGWTPTVHDQAESRLHRYGQKSTVTAWYMVGEKTIDEEIFKLLNRKREIVSMASDGVPSGVTAGAIYDDVEAFLLKGAR